MRRITVAMFVLFTSLTGCNLDEAEERICEPGRVQTCPCVLGNQGIQTCRENGLGWQECQCTQVQTPQEPSKAVSLPIQPDVASKGIFSAPRQPVPESPAVAQNPAAEKVVLPSFILNLADGTSRIFAFSGVYVGWDGSHFIPDETHFNNGYINIDPDRSEVIGSRMKLQFIRPYYYQPICNVNLDTYAGVFISVDPAKNKVDIRLHNTNGSLRDWRSVGGRYYTWILMSCHGVI